MHLAILASLFLLREIEASTSLTDAWTFDHSRSELSWKLPSSKTDHLTLGVTRKLGCFCGSAIEACPYHLACEHLDWLKAQPGYQADRTSPLFPTTDGIAATAAKVVETFEEIGLRTGMPLLSDEGIRRFGGHTPRVTGSRIYAAGIEVNKIWILARHSGDMILRYVAEAPLESLRADLGLADLHQAGHSVPAPATQSISSPGTPGRFMRDSKAANARLSVLERALSDLQETVQSQAQDVAAMSTAFCLTEQRVFVQNTASAAVHYARTNDERRSVCG